MRLVSELYDSVVSSPTLSRWPSPYTINSDDSLYRPRTESPSTIALNSENNNETSSVISGLSSLPSVNDFDLTDMDLIDLDFNDFGADPLLGMFCLLFIIFSETLNVIYSLCVCNNCKQHIFKPITNKMILSVQDVCNTSSRS